MSKSTEWKEFSNLLAAKDEKRPEGQGWFEKNEIAKRLRITPGQVRRNMISLVAKGQAEVFRGRLLNKSGRLGHAVWWRVKK